MTYERVNGHQNMNQAKDRRPSASEVRREYPGADYATSQLVTKLRSRGSANAPHHRAPSSDLMKDAYKTVPQKPTRQQTANVREIGPVLNDKYSPYSDVNVTAAKNVQAHAAGTSVRTKQPQVRTAAGASRPVQAQTRQPQTRSAQPQTRPTASRPQQRPAASVAAVERKAPAAVKTRRPAAGAQLAESGPREVALKTVPFPKLVFMILMFAIIIFLMIQSVVQNFEYQREITALQAELDSLNSRAESLRLDLEERDDLAEIERRAEEIGMIKSNSIEEKYISLEHSDIIENFGTEEDDYGSFTTMLSAVSRRLSKFFDGQ